MANQQQYKGQRTTTHSEATKIKTDNRQILARITNNNTQCQKIKTHTTCNNNTQAKQQQYRKLTNKNSRGQQTTIHTAKEQKFKQITNSNNHGKQIKNTQPTKNHTQDNQQQ
jgi:hypothetical protein